MSFQWLIVMFCCLQEMVGSADSEDDDSEEDSRGSDSGSEASEAEMSDGEKKEMAASAAQSGAKKRPKVS